MAVLIVEDNPVIAFDARDAVMDLGFECLTAHDCETARRIAETRDCICALLDFDLNGENSVEVARLLAQRGTPYCFVTGRSPEDVVTASGLEAAVYTKPANYGAIARALLEAT